MKYKKFMCLISMLKSQMFGDMTAIRSKNMTGRAKGGKKTERKKVEIWLKEQKNELHLMWKFPSCLCLNDCIRLLRYVDSSSKSHYNQQWFWLKGHAFVGSANYIDAKVVD